MTNLCLLTCVLVTAQAAELSEWLLFPRLSRGQELVYRGSFAEEALGPGAQFSRSYQLETRFFVINSTPQAHEIALYTAFGSPRANADDNADRAPSSVRLELAKVSMQGAVSADGVSLAVPLDGPATVECGAFVEFPRARIRASAPWLVNEDNRPPRSWRALGSEVISNTACLKLEGLQQSPGWDEPRGDRAAWRRRDTIWVGLDTGFACKVRRVLERRDAAHRDPTQRSITEYELQSNIQYPGRLFEDRKREITQALNFKNMAAPYLPQPTRSPQQTFDALIARIDHHLNNQPQTPYREAVLQVRRSVEAAKRGEIPPAPPAEDIPVVAAGIGQRAPDFLATNMLSGESGRLRRWLGRPIVMVFYAPASAKAEEVLRFAQSLQDRQRTGVWVLGFALSDDLDRVRRQHKNLRLSLPILSGKGLRQSYGIDATPKLVILDAEGVIHNNYVGWGLETPASVEEEVQSLVNKQKRPGPGSGDASPEASGTLPRR
jgi:peroxiredoxin